MKLSKTTALIHRAQQIVAFVNEQTPHRKRYPQEMKDIVHCLINKHKFPIKKLANTIPISVTSIRIWSGRTSRKKISFKKIAVKQKQDLHQRVPKENPLLYQSIIFLIILESLEIALILSLP